MDYKAIAEWALGERVGSSSRCIARHMIGLKAEGAFPRDSADFGRCEALLDAVPEFRQRLSEMAMVNSYWERLVARWEEIRAAPADSQYDLIQSIVRPIEDRDPRVVRLGPNVTMRRK